MILSNVDILAAIDAGRIVIDPLGARDVSGPPFQTSAIDLRLAPTITVPEKLTMSHRLDAKYDRVAAARNAKQHEISDERPYILKPNCFALAQTLELVGFPILPDGPYYAARIEGRSSLARYGMMVHFTAPTIHTAFSGPITLELINLGHNDIILTPNVYVCQLIVEQLSSRPVKTPNQFTGQVKPSG
jgi:dCTP deaminase